MMNQMMLVGRLTRDPEVNEVGENKSVSNITVAVPRPFKNADGEYETDFIDVTLWNDVASKTSEYCKKGDLVGVKGRLQMDSYENDEGKKVSKLQVIADRITFLSSRSHEEPERA
jgi:single-strand DNA-binding protein